MLRHFKVFFCSLSFNVITLELAQWRSHNVDFNLYNAWRKLWISFLTFLCTVKCKLPVIYLAKLPCIFSDKICEIVSGKFEIRLQFIFRQSVKFSHLLGWVYRRWKDETRTVRKIRSGEVEIFLSHYSFIAQSTRVKGLFK